MAHVPGARELAISPTGDLYVGTNGEAVDVVFRAGGTPGAPRIFARIPDAPVAGIALTGTTLVVGSQHGVWTVPVAADGRTGAEPHRIAEVRPDGGRGHRTTSVAVAGGTVYASVGSSCNACVEHDPTRATVLAMTPTGADRRTVAVGLRNAVALATDPATGAVWAGVAGRDDLAPGQPDEIFDPVSTRAPGATYGWPDCYDDRRSAAQPGACSNAVVPEVAFPAYETPIGAAFYPADAHGAHAFPAPGTRAARSSRCTARGTCRSCRRASSSLRCATGGRRPPRIGTTRRRSGQRSSAASRRASTSGSDARPAWPSVPTAVSTWPTTTRAKSIVSAPPPIVHH